MWFKKEQEPPEKIVMICVAHCQACGAPIFAPAALEVLKDIGTEELMKELSAKVVNFCVCHQGSDFAPMMGTSRIPEGN